MHPAKTELARTALAERDPALGPAERRLLILCDGKRPIDELTALLGPQTTERLQQLATAGFVAMQRPAAPEPVLPATAPLPRPRRSPAVAKIYMLDMLTLMRSEAADAMAAEINAATAEAGVMHAIHGALHFIAGVSGPRYARKLALQLRDTVPEPWATDMAAAIEAFSSEADTPS